jgi:hypothetical protein
VENRKDSTTDAAASTTRSKRGSGETIAMAGVADLWTLHRLISFLHLPARPTFGRSLEPR